MKSLERIAKFIAVCSLDAPVVAAVWLHEMGRLTEEWWPWEAYFLLIGAVWCIYVLDRVSDGRRLDPAAPAAARHRFARRFQPLLLTGVALVAAAGLYLVIVRAPMLILEGACVGVLALVYLHLNRRCQKVCKPFLAKEAIAAAIFALGVALIPMNGGSGFWLTISLVTFLFGWLAFYNLILIARWEAPYDHGQGTDSLGTDPRRARKALVLTKALLLSGTLVLFLSGAPETAMAVGLAGVFLYLVERFGGGLALPVRRLLADVALLGPVLLWWT